MWRYYLSNNESLLVDDITILLCMLSSLHAYMSHNILHLQQSPFFFFPFWPSTYERTEPLVVELANSFCFPPFNYPFAACALAYLSLMHFEMWKNVSLTLWPVLALVSKNAIPNSFAKAIPCSVSMTFLSVRSALFPIRTFSTFWLACTSIYLTQFLTLLKLSSDVQSYARIIPIAPL